MKNCYVLLTDHWIEWRVSFRETPSVGTQCPCCVNRLPPGVISPADLPVFSSVTPDLQPSTAPPHDDGPVYIHDRSVEEYQQIYYEVVDDMLRFKSFHRRCYSLEVGRVMKQKLWERLDRPRVTETVNEDGLVHVGVSYGFGVYPPLYVLDTTGEPRAEKAQKAQKAQKELITR